MMHIFERRYCRNQEGKVKLVERISVSQFFWLEKFRSRTLWKPWLEHCPNFILPTGKSTNNLGIGYARDGSCPGITQGWMVGVSFNIYLMNFGGEDVLRMVEAMMENNN